jgi:hypothetical protein
VKLREHVVLGGGMALALSPVLGAPGSAIFWAASVLIDCDHYGDYLHRNGFRDWSPRRMFEFHRLVFLQIRRPDFLALSLCHTVEFFTFVYVAAAVLRSSVLWAVFWGMCFHLLLDVVWLAWHRAVFSRAFSLIEYAIRRRRMRGRGLDPDLVYEEVLTTMGITGTEPAPLLSSRSSPS